MSQSNVKQNVLTDFKVGGDFTFEGNINQTVVQQKPDFFEPSLEKYQSSSFTSPKITLITLQILLRLKHLRFLVLAGSPDVDKDSLARHTAFRLREELVANGEQITVKEWYRRSDSQSIEIELQNTEQSTVFILTQITSQNIGYDLNKIEKAAKSTNHYVIASTEITFTAWRQPDNNKKHWYEVSPEQLDDCEELVNQYSQENYLSKWYLQTLEPRERLLALGLSFFDGLFDAQFFAALEEIVEKVWQKRDSSLRALDYCDFENLHGFFNFTETHNQGTKINIRFPKSRRILFKIAWNRERRQILSALPIMVEIVNQSVSESWLNPELYETQTKCNEIRKVIAETISDIGSISANSVQTTLLQLAANNDRRVQSTAAYAMARWRDPDYHLDQQLFDSLQSWLDTLQIIEQVEAILKGGNPQNHEDFKAENYIKMTVALTVGYASLYDPPRGISNSPGLSEELDKLLKKLINDPSENVRNTVLFSTLPQVLQLHLHQLSQWLHDLTKQQTNLGSKQEGNHSSEKSIIQFNQAVGISLAFAYQNYPKDTLEILKNWTDEASKDTTDDIDKSKITSRESVLSTVVRAYGEFNYIQGDNFLTPQDIFIQFHKRLKEEKHPFVRKAILFAIGRQARRDFESIERYLQELVAEVRESERQDIVDILSDIYFEQRVNLSGGDYWVTKKLPKSNYSYRYQIWIDKKRPETSIETSMYNWSKNSNNQGALKIAFLSFTSFANLLDQDEKKEKDRIIESLNDESKSQTPISMDDELKSSPNLYVKLIVPWLTIVLKWGQYSVFNRSYYKVFAPKIFHYKQVVFGSFSEVLKQYSGSKDIINEIVIQRFRDREDKEINIIGDILDLAIILAKNPSLVIVPVAIFIIFIIIVAWFLHG